MVGLVKGTWLIFPETAFALGLRSKAGILHKFRGRMVAALAWTGRALSTLWWGDTCNHKPEPCSYSPSSPDRFFLLPPPVSGNGFRSSSVDYWRIINIDLQEQWSRWLCVARVNNGNIKEDKDEEEPLLPLVTTVTVYVVSIFWSQMQKTIETIASRS